MDGTAREKMLELVALYALGVLPREDAALVAAFIANDDEARAEYLDLRAAADALALTADEPVDSARTARMKERLMARVRAGVPADGSIARRRFAPTPAWFVGAGLLTAAAVIFSLVTVTQDVSLRGDLAAAQRRATTLQTQMAQGERTSARTRDDLTQTLTDLVSPDARHYEVAQGTVVVRGQHIYFALSKLPALPRGHVYQAWTAAKGSAVMQPSITFTPNGSGVAVVALPVDAQKVGTVAVSVEPEGGSKAPTTTPTFVRPLT
ncbi:MAG TPA: anti-sigma factor [Candidatus Sulfotelmatobacter sp.]|nr:anti-sigma factor [Candidatus Sulfotelmatobacter sp.]